MTGSPVLPSSSTLPQVNLQTLVAAIQNSVQAQNLIATDITKVTSAFASFNTDFVSFNNLFTSFNNAFTSFNTAFSTAFPPPLSSSTSWTPGGISTATITTQTVTVSGAALGNYVHAALTASQQNCLLNGYVAAADTVKVILANNTGATVTFTATTLKVRVTTQ